MRHALPLGRLLFTIVALGASAVAPRARAETRNAPPPPRDAPTMKVVVDARDIARRLVRTEVTIELPADRRGKPVPLRYVEWTPGNHNPSGPIQNVVDLVVRDGRGGALRWRRDETSVFRHIVDAPADAERLVVSFSYIANQPGVNSRSSDTYGFETFGGLNWNTVLVYPEWANRASARAEATLRLPAGWRAATALRGADGWTPGAGGDEVRFQPCALAELVDSPVIFGEHLRTWTLSPLPAGEGAKSPVYLHAVAPRAEQLELPAARIEKLNAMIEQAAKVFGPNPYDRFHFLILLGDELPGFGLEHATSTYISMKEDRFTKAESDEGDPMTVVPHELAHVWCGKFSAPVDLHHDDYHTPCDTGLLWVYEGLASYVDEVLAARSALMSREQYEHALVNAIVGYQNQAGRRWRSVEDTALAMRFLRAPSDAWPDLRRSQDYYVEGGLFWMTADAIIRAQWAEQPSPRTLDDFCRAFFGLHDPRVRAPGVPTVTYGRDNVVQALGSVGPGQDWNALIRDMIESPRAGDAAAFDLPARLGYRLEWTDEPTAEQAKAEKKEEGASLRWSIGLVVDKDGKVTRLTPGYPADRAAILLGDRVVAVREAKKDAEKKFTAQLGETFALTPARLRDAVRASATTDRVELLIRRGDRFLPVALDFGGGLRYPRLVRDETKPDVLRDILNPR